MQKDVSNFGGSFELIIPSREMTCVYRFLISQILKGFKRYMVERKISLYKAC